MIETNVKDWLEGGVSVPVALETPPGPPESYVVLEKIASGEENGIARATITAKSAAPSLHEAALLNERVKARMAGFILLSNIFRCHCDSDYNNSDTRLNIRRYQAVFTIYYKRSD